MSNTSSAVDAYIACTPDYARPILVKIRELYHTACPDVTESMKWGHPFFSHEGILGNMPAFKKFVRMSFWNSAAMGDPQNIFSPDEYGTIKFASVADMPSDEILIAYIRDSMAVNEAGGVTTKPTEKKEPSVLEVPEDFTLGLRADTAAADNFDSFSPGKRRDYVEWIVGAKQAATRTKRIATAVAQIAEGKALHWKYEKR